MDEIKKQCKLFGKITSKAEAFEKPLYPFPGERTDEHVVAKLTIAIHGYSVNDGVSAIGSSAKMGSIYVTVDGSEALAQLNAGDYVNVTVEATDPTKLTKAEWA